jgi:hypothetical protein
VEPLVPSEGWGVLHLFYVVDRERAETEPGGAKRFLDAVASLEADGHQALLFAVLGHKADLGVMALGPDVARLQAAIACEGEARGPRSIPVSNSRIPRAYALKSARIIGGRLISSRPAAYDSPRWNLSITEENHVPADPVSQKALRQAA